MLLRLIVLTICMTLSLAFAEGRRTLFVDKMGGFEKFVEEAILESETQIEFIEEAEHPDLKVLLGKQFTSVYAEIVYNKQTGRKGESILKLVDVKTGKELAAHRFVMQDSEASKKKAARDFARLVSEKLKQ